MSESFGARMRQRREEQQIALATIAEQTKIKTSLLEALERDDVSHWPSGIFRRAFIRAYARAISVDPDVIVHEFCAAFPEPVEEVTPAAIAAAADAARGMSTPPNRLRSFFDSAVGSLSRRRRGPDDFVAPLTVANDQAEEPGEEPGKEPSAEVATESFLPRGLGQMEKALDMISASARNYVPQAWSPDFLQVAELCTALARVEDPNDVRRLLQRAAGILNAIGAVVWVWDPSIAALKPAVASGYSDAVLAYWPNVQRDADNVTARAFRTGQACSIEGDEQGSSALVVPLITPIGSSGVLAIELQDSSRIESVRAAATIIAAQFSQLVGGAAYADDADPSISPADPYAAQLSRAGAGA